LHSLSLFFTHSSKQDHHDDIRQEQKWEMQALSSSQSNPTSANIDDSNEHNNGNCDSSAATSPTAELVMATAQQLDTVSCNHVENGINTHQHINNNTIAINNNNCDTIKNNNQTVTAPLEMVNDVEAAVPTVTLIDQQNALLRGVNIGELLVCGSLMKEADNHAITLSV